LNLEVLPVTEQHERVALVDETDIPALAAHFGTPHIRFHGVVRPLRPAHEEPRAAADSLVPRPYQDAASVDGGGNAFEVGCPPHRRGLHALEINRPRQSGNHAHARLTADACDRGFRPAEPAFGATYCHPRRRRRQQIECPLRFGPWRSANEVALGIEELEGKRLLRSGIQKSFIREDLDLCDGLG
jgi:hypothetical protein